MATDPVTLRKAAGGSALRGATSETLRGTGAGVEADPEGLLLDGGKLVFGGLLKRGVLLRG